MTTELRPTTETAWQPEQIALLKRTIAKGATDDEFALFLNVCRHRGLDPFAGQIRPIKRWDATLQRESMTIQTGIDGFRIIADRTGLYAGNERPVYEYEADDLSHPSVAVMTVYKLVQGHRVSFTAEARWDAYVQHKRDGSVTEMWRRMGHLLLAKCAEALVLRQAFPQELSKIYAPEEMMHAEEATSDSSLSDGVKEGTKDPKRAALTGAQATLRRRREIQVPPPSLIQTAPIPRDSPADGGATPTSLAVAPQQGADAPGPLSTAPDETHGDDPAETWRGKLRTAFTVQSINAIWRTIPEELKQECYGIYADCLKAKGAVKR